MQLVNVHDILNDSLAKDTKKKYHFAAPSYISSTKGIQEGFDKKENARSRGLNDIENIITTITHHQCQ